MNDWQSAEYSPHSADLQSFERTSPATARKCLLANTQKSTCETRWWLRSLGHSVNYVTWNTLWQEAESWTKTKCVIENVRQDWFCFVFATSARWSRVQHNVTCYTFAPFHIENSNETWISRIIYNQFFPVSLRTSMKTHLKKIVGQSHF